MKKTPPPPPPPIMDKKPTLLYMTYYRAVAILFILLGHTFIIGKGVLFKSLSFFIGGGTLYFVFIAGFLFKYLSYKFEYKSFLKRKFLNIILPFWFIMLPLCCIYIQNPPFEKDILYYMDNITRFITPFFFGQILNGSTWFMGMIVIFFILSPLFLKLEKNKKIWYTVLLISILGTIFIPRTRLHLPRVLMYASLFRISVSFIWQFIGAFLYFSSAWLLGMEMCNFTEKNPDYLKENKNYYLIRLCLTLILIYVCFVFIANLPDRLFGAGKLTIALLIFLLLYNYSDKISKIGILDKILKLLSKYSFGIFFIHGPILHCMRTGSLIPNGIKVISKTNGEIFELFAASGLEFVVALFSSILILFTIKYILEKLNVKHTRWFIGV